MSATCENPDCPHRAELVQMRKLVRATAAMLNESLVSADEAPVECDQ